MLFERSRLAPKSPLRVQQPFMFHYRNYPAERVHEWSNLVHAGNVLGKNKIGPVRPSRKSFFNGTTSQRLKTDVGALEGSSG